MEEVEKGAARVVEVVLVAEAGAGLVVEALARVEAVVAVRHARYRCQAAV